MNRVSYHVEDRLAIITLTRPDKLNALSAESYRQLDAAIALAAGDEAAGAVVLEAQGRAFAAGADIEDYVGMRAKPFRAFIDNSRAVVRGLSECPKPIVAAVQGFALGGGFELALACDLIFAAQNARFGMPEGRLGLVPGGGGTARLPRLIGRLRANDLIMAGRILTADEALSWGLVSRVCAKEELAAAARAAAHSALDHSPESLAVAKRLVAAAGEGPLEGDLAREAELSAPLIDTPNAREGIAAFAAKRPPDFH